MVMLCSFLGFGEDFVLVFSNNHLVAAWHHITALQHFGHLRTSLAAEWSSVEAPERGRQTEQRQQARDADAVK